MTEIIHIDIYNADILLHIGNNKQLLKYMRANGLASYIKDMKQLLGKNEQTTLGRTMQLDNGQTIILFKRNPEPSLLAHEVFHAACMILNRIGITLSDESDEAYAYLIQFITQKICNVVTLSPSDYTLYQS